MGTSLLALLDDIASILDDVAVLTKVATKKTAGVLGDDLALNAEQVSGVDPERELPVVWAVAKGSAINKLILVPTALVISAVSSWAVTGLLMVGGTFLCFEGFEKVAHKLTQARAGEASQSDAEAEAERALHLKALANPEVDLVALEKTKIKGAIRTDFVLSAEIIVISLGTVVGKPFGTRLAVLAGIAAIMTVGVYGLVAGIVKLDDAGLHLSKSAGEGGAARAQRALGRAILRAAPWLMKGLSVAGTAAMFLVGGGILTHGIPPLHHFIEGLTKNMSAVPALVVPSVIDAMVGIVAGAVTLAIVMLVKRVFAGRKTQPAG